MRMNVYIYKFIQICIYICIYIYIFVYIFVYTYNLYAHLARACTKMKTYSQLHTCVSPWLRKNVRAVMYTKARISILVMT